jgi:hypothetical protein
MKKLSVFLALAVLLFTEAVFAASAVVTSATGTVQFQTGTLPARTLRVGDEVAQGDTVFTGANSSVVLKFDDGQVAAMTSNSRMTITSYQYNPASESGNVLLSLISGGMRAISGLIGKKSPNQVAYRAATATIGIRGSDCVMATDGASTVVAANEGACTLQLPGKELIVIPAGQAVLVRPDGTVVRGTIQQILSQLPPSLAAQVNGLNGMNSQIRDANAGEARQGQQGQQGQDGQQNGQGQGGQQGQQGQQGGGGGGGGSSRQ